MATLKNNTLYFYELMNDIIELSLKESLLQNLERDLTLRNTTLDEKLSYLIKIKREFIEFLDKNTTIEAYHLIDIEKQNNTYSLNKNQFLDFCSFWIDPEIDFEENTSKIINDNKGNYSEIVEKINDYYSDNNAFTPEQITRLSFWMYCINSNIENIEKQQPEKFTPNLTIFKNRESHLFFNYLFNDWLKDIEACRPQLSYIVWAMTKEKKENDLETENLKNDFSITCPSMGEFAKFWNSYQHPFKLTFKKSKPNLSDEPSIIHKAPFDNRKEEFYKNIM